MLEKAISYPAAGERAVRAFAIGALLSLFGFLVLPALVVFGYLMRVLRQGSDETPDVPAYDEWGALLVDGLKAAVISVGYFIVPVVVAFVAFVAVISFSTVEVVETNGVADVAVQPEAAAGAGLVGALLLVAFAIAAVWALAALYVLPAGLTHFAVTGRLSAAFAVRRFAPVLTSGTYFLAWLFALAVSVAAGVVAGFVGLVPILGAVLSAVVLYYANVVAFRLYGQGYAQSVPVEDGPEPATEQPVA